MVVLADTLAFGWRARADLNCRPRMAPLARCMYASNDWSIFHRHFPQHCSKLSVSLPKCTSQLGETKRTGQGPMPRAPGRPINHQNRIRLFFLSMSIGRSGVISDLVWRRSRELGWKQNARESARCLATCASWGRIEKQALGGPRG